MAYFLDVLFTVSNAIFAYGCVESLSVVHAWKMSPADALGALFKLSSMGASIYLKSMFGE